MDNNGISWWRISLRFGKLHLLTFAAVDWCQESQKIISFAPDNFAEKCVLKVVEPFSHHSLATLGTQSSDNENWQRQCESPQDKPKLPNSHVWWEKHLLWPSHRNVRIGILPLWQITSTKLQFFRGIFAKIL